MATSKDSGLIVEREFECFEEFSYTASVWDADFRQMSTEKFRSKMFQAWVGNILISNGRLGCHVEQHGITPSGMRTFAIPASDSPEMLWFGHTVTSGSLLSFPVHGEIDVYSRPGFDTLTFSIPEELLMRLMENSGFTEPGKVLQSVEQIFLPGDELLNSLRYLLGVLVPELVKKEDRQPFMVAEIQQQILSTLIKSLDKGSPGIKHVQDHRIAVLDHVIDYIQDYPHADKPLLVSDLCTISNVSERTLENLFRLKLGMTPKAYLKGKRLHGAHRELWQSQPATSQVTDIANNWGFWHMGHFAADYRKMFGELPSETLQRSP